eukprot:s2586_g6.t1
MCLQQVFRDEADGEDLRLLAAECLGVSREDPASRNLVNGFCKAGSFRALWSTSLSDMLRSFMHIISYHPNEAFQEISAGRWTKSKNAFGIFHLRDFHHCLRYLRRGGLVRNGSVSASSVLSALERNFGGLKKEDFVALCKVFFGHLREETGGRIPDLEEAGLRSSLAVLQEALLDIPEADLQDANYEPCRYKLIIDETEDGGAVRILQLAGLLPPQVKVLEVSNLPGDQSDLHRSQIVSEIRRAAEHPGLCVMVDFDEILDGFYDLLNLRFQRIQANGRVSFAATVAAGSYSVLAPVDPRFQLVVCIKASDLAQTPLPFLNRFEKFYLGPADLAMHNADIRCHHQLNLQFIRDYLLQPVRQRLQALVQLLGPASLIGFDATTMDSAINEAMQASRCQTALQLLTAGWDREEGPGAEESKTEKGAPLSEEWPGDLKVNAIQSEPSDPAACKGHENPGNTCFLQACLVILCMHEAHLLPEEREAEPFFLSDLRHILKKSRRQQVPQEDIWSLAQKLEREGIMQPGEQDDAVEMFEALLDKCQSPKLALPTMTCAREADYLGLDDPSRKVYVSNDLNEYILRTAMGSDKDFADLLQDIVMESVTACKVEFGEEGSMKELELPTAVRARRRLPGQLPPRILPFCFGRWNAESMQKNDGILTVPMEGLTLPLLPPSQDSLLLSHMEHWLYDLVSFIAHTGSLDNGHYIAYFKARNGWEAVDNDRCYQLSAADARHQAGKAYLLVYRPDG